jgi:hypothetical protein
MGLSNTLLAPVNLDAYVLLSKGKSRKGRLYERSDLLTRM